MSETQGGTVCKLAHPWQNAEGAVFMEGRTMAENENQFTFENEEYRRTRETRWEDGWTTIQA